MIDSVFERLDGRPTQEQKDTWKAKHGEVFCISSSKGNVYISKPNRAVLSLILTKVKTDI